MSWIIDYTRFRHDVFIVFIECKIEGRWDKKSAFGDKSGHEVLYTTDGSEKNIVHVIEPDGLRRMLHFQMGATISISGNVMSYASGQAEEMTVDEKVQAGKGKTRDIL